jgi:ssDNA-binding Zn-finger/Zn-ribbon topoisomerase 1
MMMMSLQPQRFRRCRRTLGLLVAPLVAVLSSSSLHTATVAAAFAPPVVTQSHHHPMHHHHHPLQASFLLRRYHNNNNNKNKNYVLTLLYQAKPKRGSVVDSYRTVGVNCAKCRTQLFRYKKKNGTKSNLVKCYIERISEDTAGVLKENLEESSSSSLLPNNNQSSLEDLEWKCPNCQSNFARARTIHGRPALKLVGGKIRMTK